MLASEILDAIASDFEDLEKAQDAEDRLEVWGSIKGGFEELREITARSTYIRENGCPPPLHLIIS